MPVELVIFDCDGVLVDSERISVRVGTAALRELGWSIDEEEYAARFVGCSDEEWDRAVGEVPAGWRERLAAAHEAALTAELVPVPGIVAALDGLSVPVCVASNGSHAKIRRSLELTGLAERFAGNVFSAEDVARGKPAPDLFLFAASALGVPAERCVVVEDSAYGVMAAEAAGMRCLALVNGLVPPARLSPATHVADPALLPSLIGRVFSA
ncbi:HAD family hydrolase [Nonomuraea aurantiaca]|uniref:HAD family hydrolase n=1 Tax=Nonomuraea aurantiaca TaxID=2878562 RepID=UPI001CD948DA|nr:HAD family hydrolase [Nonomuraea aurantiaca]MCA2220498.1 HAD family hydrolase [Nonomuraea aurantiaca]